MPRIPDVPKFENPEFVRENPVPFIKKSLHEFFEKELAGRETLTAPERRRAIDKGVALVEELIRDNRLQVSYGDPNRRPEQIPVVVTEAIDLVLGGGESRVDELV